MLIKTEAAGPHGSEVWLLTGTHKRRQHLLPGGGTNRLAAGWYHLDVDGQLSDASEPVHKVPGETGIHFIGKNCGDA